MGKKNEGRLIQEIECTANSALIDKDLKKEMIEKNVKFLKKYGYTKSWWYRYELPIILKRLSIKNG